MPDKPIVFKRTPDDNPGGKPICDFCGEQDPVAMFPADAFAMSLVTPEGTYTQDFMGDGWAACAWCELLVEAKDIPRLVERYFVVHPLPAKLPPKERAFMRGLVSTQFDLFFEHQAGPGVSLTASTPS